MILLLFTACTAPDAPSAEKTEPEMDPVALLTRLSLDLRGVRPTVDEVAAVEADPDSVDDYVDPFLQDERFGQRVRDIYADVFLTRTENRYIDVGGHGLSNQVQFEQSLGEEVLYIVSTVAEDDLPYTDVVTADWTVVDESLAELWPTDYPAGTTGWQKVHYTDDRPAAGILATNAMWWRYVTTTSNANRGRANAISRIFLCNDYLLRPIDFDTSVDLLDGGAVSEALQTSPGCVNCHVSLDPLAGYLFGFLWYNFKNPVEASVYHPERELLWQTYTGSAPGYYGEPGYSLAQLGQQLAGDERFVTCAVQEVYGGLLRRDVTADDMDSLVQHREAFLDGGLTLRSLFRSVVTDPRYRAGATDTEGYVPKKMVSPELLSSQVEDLTGFDFTYEMRDMMRTDRLGLRVLAGGADGVNVARSARAPNSTLALVQERLAELSAWHAAARDVATDSPELFTDIDFTETPEAGRDAMVTQIQSLYLRILQKHVEADGDEVNDALDLWSSLYALDGDSTNAWAGVLSVILRDPDLLFY